MSNDPRILEAGEGINPILAADVALRHHEARLRQQQAEQEANVQLATHHARIQREAQIEDAKREKERAEAAERALSKQLEGALKLNARSLYPGSDAEFEHDWKDNLRDAVLTEVVTGRVDAQATLEKLTLGTERANNLRAMF